MTTTIRGRIEFEVNRQSFVLEEGDSIQFNSSYPHNGSVVSEGGAELLCVVFNGSGSSDERALPKGQKPNR